MRRTSIAALAFLIFAAVHPAKDNSPKLAVKNLRCEYLTNPLGIDVAQPRLSWILESLDVSLRGQRQTAYQIIVARTPEKVDADQGDAWDSGKISSDQTIQVSYAGKRLESKTRYYWKIRVWDESGNRVQLERAGVLVRRTAG